MTYSPEHDYNTADAGGGSFDLIPVDTVAKVNMTIRPGGLGDGGWLTQSKSSDAQYLNLEFTITEGEYAKRKFWGNLTVSGGKVDDLGNSKAGNITRETLRAILESARGINPTDESDEAKRKRLVNGYGDFNGLEFWAKVGIEPARGEYQAKNKLGAVITPDKEGYGGAPVQPAGNGATAAQPAWAGSSPQKADTDVTPDWAR